jgi:hypothetical protein
MGSPFPGPTPAYTNPPIQPLNYKPRRFVISAISLGVQTLVTTDLPMNYVIGQLVRLLIPNGYGSLQLNNVDGYVIGIPAANQVLLDINSSQNVNQFVNIDGTQQPQIIPVGDVNSGVISSTGSFVPSAAIPGAFINIS